MAAARDCDATAGDIAGKLQTLRAWVERYSGIWQGAAAVTFIELMREFDINAGNLHQSLTEIAAALRKNAAHYVEGERANVASIVAVNGDIPTARL